MRNDPRFTLFYSAMCYINELCESFGIRSNAAMGLWVYANVCLQLSATQERDTIVGARKSAGGTRVA